MAGRSNQKKPWAKRWTLQSPKGKPATTATRNIGVDPQPVLAEESHRIRVSESSDRVSVHRQEHAQQATLTDQPEGKQARAWNLSTGTRAATCVDDERSISTAGAAVRSAVRITSGKIPRRRSPSPLTQPRRKMPVSIAGIMKHFRRSKLVDQAISGRATSGGQQCSSVAEGEASSSTDTNSRHAKPPLLQRGDKICGPEALLATEREEKEDEVTVSSCAVRNKSGGTSTTGDAQEGHISTSCEASCCEVGSPGQSKGQHVVVHPPQAAKQRMRRECTRLEVGEDAFKAVKGGRQPPRIAFIGVFLSGVAVTLASFVPFGAADARTALVKALLLEPSISVLPGSCYTARGSALAVHIVVDHKHRVYACVTAEDVPFSLALSLLEEVQIEYISTTSTLAFSTKENSHNTRCHAHMGRSWAKYEAVERALVRERKTRRLLGEAPLDIERPLSRDNKSYTGAKVVPLHFNAQHQCALLNAELEISSLPEEGEERRCAGDVGGAEASSSAGAATVVGKRRNRTTRTAAFLAAAVSVVLGASYAARRAYVSF